MTPSEYQRRWRAKHRRRRPDHLSATLKVVERHLEVATRDERRRVLEALARRVGVTWLRPRTGSARVVPVTTFREPKALIWMGGEAESTGLAQGEA
jgi:hypothetical protein